MADASTVEAVAAPAAVEATEVPATQSVPDGSASSAGTAASDSHAGPAAAPDPICQAASPKKLGPESAAAGPVATPDLTNEILKAQELNMNLKKMLADDAHAAHFGTLLQTPNKFKTATGFVKPRTFTSNPPVHRARQFPKPDYTHNEMSLLHIANETKSLVKRLQGIYSRPVGGAASPLPVRPSPCEVSSHSNNRRKYQDKVALENLRIYERLQRVRPSPDTARNNLANEYSKVKKYSQNCARHRRTTAPEPTVISTTVLHTPVHHPVLHSVADAAAVSKPADAGEAATTGNATPPEVAELAAEVAAVNIAEPGAVVSSAGEVTGADEPAAGVEEPAAAPVEAEEVAEVVE